MSSKCKHNFDVFCSYCCYSNKLLVILYSFKKTTHYNMTNTSIYLQRVNDGNTNFLKANKTTAKISRTGVFICLNGEVQIDLDGVRYRLFAHSMITYFAYSELRVKFRSSDLKGIIIGGDLEAIQPLLYKISDFYSLFMIRNNPYVALTPLQEKSMLMYVDLIEDILNRLHGNYDTDHELIQHVKDMRLMQLELLGNSLMLNIMSCLTHFDPKTKTISHKDEILIKFVQSLYKNYVEQHEVTFYSEEQFLTTRYFSAIIKEKSGKTPSEWIATALLVDAKTQLRECLCSIKEISDNLNFPNQSYFGKWFKNLTGISPMDFRQGMETKSPEDEFTEMIRQGATIVNCY